MGRWLGIAAAAVGVGALVRLALRGCLLQPHQDVLVFGDRGRLYLRCLRCRRETEGWKLGGKQEAQP